MRYTAAEKLEIIRTVEDRSLGSKRTLAPLEKEKGSLNSSSKCNSFSNKWDKVIVE